MKEAQVRTSRFLSLVLRHKPEAAGLCLDESGWCSVTDLLNGCTACGHKISRESLEEIVTQNDKQRFQFSADGKKIRAVQGHSVAVDLKYESVEPPETLYHGTATRFIESIRRSGLIKGSRQHVHLSSSIDAAVKVGARHGNSVVIPVDTKSMTGKFIFYNSPNGIWLVDSCPPQYLLFHNLIYPT